MIHGQVDSDTYYKGIIVHFMKKKADVWGKKKGKAQYEKVM